MYIRLAVGRVVPKHREAFLKAIHEDALGANTTEPYNVNYHVAFGLPPHDDIYMIYQVYKDKRGYYAHIETPHSRNFSKFQNELRERGDPWTERVLDFGLLEAESFMPADDEWRTKGVRLM